MAPSTRRFRPEIQGLRAIAVLAVLVYHVWPGVLSGGYVGVDVFFVISGYLITGGLAREGAATGSISLARFYQRRIKRLLPAATATLVGTAIASTFLPVVTWANTAREVIASTLYAQNWWLAERATNYLAQDDAASPLQHFWSLSVEEQYYVVWPVVVLIALVFARRMRCSARAAIAVPVVLISLVSLTYSVYLSNADPGLAYFATTTRAWELSMGGALALLPEAPVRSPRAARGLGLLGLGMVAAACVVLNDETLFPGYAALLPTLGTAAVIAAGRSAPRWSAYHLLERRVFQYFGDISYSLYLWHWPVVILFHELRGGTLSIADGLAIVSIAVSLAHLSKAYIEDRFRRPGRFGAKAWQTFLLGAICMAASVGAAWSLLQAYTRHLEAPSPAVPAEKRPATLTEKERVGAALRAAKDLAPAYGKNCITNKKGTTPRPCSSGDPGSTVHVALLGDSHAVQWEPAFARLAQAESWKLSLYAKSACPLGDLAVGVGSPKVHYKACDSYRENLIREMQNVRPDLIVVTQSRAYEPLEVAGQRPKEALADALIRTVRRLQDAGLDVVLLADTPRMDRNTPECLSSPRFVDGACDTTRRSALTGMIDPIVLAGERDSSVDVVSMTEHFCDATTCPAIRDGVVVYRDHHHLTATFVATLWNELGDALVPHLPRNAHHDRAPR